MGDDEESSGQWSPSERPDIPNNIEEVVAYGDGGRLLVAEAHRYDPEVRSFEARLDRQGVDIEKVTTGMDEIQSAKEGGEVRTDEATTSEASQEVRDLRELFRIGMNQNASDIHIRIDRQNDEADVWFRIHGDMTHYVEWGVGYANSLCHALYNTMTDVSDPSFNPLERQDARIVSRDYLPPNIHGIRVATTPTEGGYAMVLRLLYEELEGEMDLADLGYNDVQVNLLNEMEKAPTGLNVISGPTGGGKSTTLKVALSDIFDRHEGKVNILTVEEPPEYPIKGALQTPVSNVDDFEDRNKAFNEAIAGTMRVDPDIIMIGEIRDEATASLALRAAMTGHAVWSTLHANSALDVIDRLLDLEVREEYLSNPTVLSGTVYQQLLRTLCSNCKQEVPIDEVRKQESALDYHEGMSQKMQGPLYKRGEGCRECDDTGIGGRTVVAEIFKPDLRAFHYIQENDREGLWNHWLHNLEGATLFPQVMQKINQGIVDPFMVRETLGPMLYRQARWDEMSD